MQFYGFAILAWENVVRNRYIQFVFVGLFQNALFKVYV